MNETHSLNEKMKHMKEAVCDGMKQREDKEHETYLKINQPLNRDKTGDCLLPSGVGR